MRCCRDGSGPPIDQGDEPCRTTSTDSTLAHWQTGTGTGIGTGTQSTINAPYPTRSSHRRRRTTAPEPSSRYPRTATMCRRPTELLGWHGTHTRSSCLFLRTRSCGIPPGGVGGRRSKLKALFQSHCRCQRLAHVNFYATDRSSIDFHLRRRILEPFLSDRPTWERHCHSTKLLSGPFEGTTQQDIGSATHQVAHIAAHRVTPKYGPNFSPVGALALQS